MTTSSEVLVQALLLPDRDRAQIAGSLLSSLDKTVEPPGKTSAAWKKEVEKRLAQIDAKEVECVPWMEIRERLRKKHRAKA